MRHARSLPLLLVLLVPAAGGADTAVAVAAGSFNTCAIDAGGGVQCWGDNGNQQLGDGTTTASAVPVPVVGLGVQPTSILTNNSHSCALGGGGVHCWGWGYWAGGILPGPTPVPGLESGIAEIRASTWFFCARTEAGAVLCESYDPPVAVGGLEPGAASFSTAGNHGCAVVDGGARCWGNNAQGQLGEGGNVTFSESALPVLGLSSGIVSVTAHASTSCALGASGAVWCWGENPSGALGVESWDVPFSASPLAIPGLPGDVVSIGTGVRHACARTASGEVWCWGGHGRGQLGAGPLEPGGPTPVRVAGLEGVVELAVGAVHNCARTGGGALHCWGWNVQGQLGDGTTQDRSIPVQVLGFAGTGPIPAAGPVGLLLLALLLVACGRRARDGPLSPCRSVDGSLDGTR